MRPAAGGSKGPAKEKGKLNQITVTGMVLGTVLCLAQQHFGFLRMGNNYITEAYPVVVHPGDVLLVLATVAAMGFVAAYWPVRYVRVES